VLRTRQMAENVSFGISFDQYCRNCYEYFSIHEN